MLQPSPRVADAPTIYELMDEYKTSATKRRVAEAMLQGGEWARSLMAPPGTPADRVAILRAAYEKAMKDPDLLAEAKKLRNKIKTEEVKAKKFEEENPFYIPETKGDPGELGWKRAIEELAKERGVSVKEANRRAIEDRKRAQEARKK